jgi:NitT/TauT family transport system substrate-binding protein
MPIKPTRRNVLKTLAAAGAASLVGPRHGSAEPSPETDIVRFTQSPGICIAPQYVAEALIRADGFTGFGYVKQQAGLAAIDMLARGVVDFAVDFGTAFAIPIDQGAPIKILSGVHVGCYELFAREGIESVLDLKGKTVGAGRNLGSDPHIFISVMATYVGLDPLNDIRWVASDGTSIELFEKGEIDAFIAFPPEAQLLRSRGVGHVIVNSILDRPWSQYFCCMLAANSAYVQEHPVATKRIVRAILKATDICAADPEGVARLLVEGGHTDGLGAAAQAVSEISYANWREYDAEDTVRFYALRLHEAGMVRNSPEDIISAGTDWRFLNEIKRELKG